MYNLYKHSKLLKDKVEKKKEYMKEEQIKKSRKSKLYFYLERMDELVDHYNNRVKNFLYDMSKSPVKVNEYEQSQVHNTTRQQYYIDKNKELYSTGKFPRNFSFNTFQTDRERIKKMNQLKETLHYNKSTENLMTNQAHTNYLQPTMRFKPRTELERIFDSANLNSFGRIDKNLINQQLKSLDLLDFKKLSQEDDQLDIPVYHSINKLKLTFYEENGQMKASSDKNLKSINSNSSIRILKKKKVPRKHVDNSIAKNIMKDLHVKTHFKAASIYTLGLQSESKIKKTNTNLESARKFTEESVDSKESFNKNTNYRKKNRTISYNLEFNPIKKKKEEVLDIGKLKILEELSKSPSLTSNNPDGLKKSIENLHIFDKNKLRRNGNVTSILKTNPMDFFKKITENIMNHEPIKVEEEKITIAGETYLKSQLDVISKKVLQQCNFTRDKSKCNNVRLKCGAGKLASTAGMSINEFSQKYKLNNL
jgi:hypothetical protein